MNLALHDVRRHAGRFVGTAAGLGLLFAVVLAMAGIYAGLSADAVSLTAVMHADLWIVQRGTRGPFADPSRLDPSLEARVAAVPGVASARTYTYATIQRDVGGEVVRMALVGLTWPVDRGDRLPIVAGRGLAYAHGDIIVDRSLGRGLGERLSLGGETYRIVGLTRGALTSGGEPVAFLTLADAQLVALDLPAETHELERWRVLDALRATDLGRSQPALEELAVDPRWRRPALPPAGIAAVLVTLEAPHRIDEVRRVIGAWPDVTAYTVAEEETFLLDGMVKKARLQLGLFSVILTVTAAILVAMVIYTMTREKTHDIALLRLLGAPTSRIALLVLQEAWLLGALGYAVARFVGAAAFPHFARRVVLTPGIEQAAPILVMVVVSLASLLGVLKALRVDVSRVLEA
jgi:putative ABC transport system permease protein